MSSDIPGKANATNGLSRGEVHASVRVARRAAQQMQYECNKLYSNISCRYNKYISNVIYQVWYKTQHFCPLESDL